MHGTADPKISVGSPIRKAAAVLALAACTALSGATGARALGDYEYVGSLELVGFPFCPQGTDEARGQYLGIADFQTLYSVIGNIYGGDKSKGTFRLPDLSAAPPAGGMRYCIVLNGAYPQRN